jgi:hypothetical protein
VFVHARARARARKEGGREVWEGRERKRNAEKRKRGGHKTKEQVVKEERNQGHHHEADRKR